MEGVQGSLSKQMVGASAVAGSRAGTKAGGSFVQRMKSKVGGAKGKIVGGLAAGAGVAAVAKGFYNLGSKADDMRATLIKSTGASGKALKSMTKDAKGIATTFPVSFHDAATAVGSLKTSTGATGPVLQKLAGHVLEASRALGEDGTANADAFGNALNEFQIPAKDGAKHLNVLVNASQKYGTSIGDTLGDLQKFGPQMKSAGLSMDQTVDLFGQFNKAGVSANRIVPSLNAAFLKWSKAGKDPSKMLGKLSDKITGATTQQDAMTAASKYFSGPGASAFVSALRSGQASLDDLGSGLSDSSQSFNHLSGGTQALSEKMQILKNKAFAALMPVALKVFDVLAKLGGWMADHAKIVGVIAAVIGGVLVTAFVAWAASAAAAAAAMVLATWPVLAIAAGIAALIAVVVLLVKHWDTVKAVAVKVWKAVKHAVMTPVNAVIDWFKSNILPFFTDTIPGVWDTVKQVTKTAFGLVKKYIIDPLKTVYHWVVDSFVKPLIDRIESIWGWVKGTFRGLWHGIEAIFVDPVRAAYDWVKNVFVGSIIGAFESVWNWVKTTFAALWHGIEAVYIDPLRAAYNWVKNTFFGSITGKIGAVWGWVKGTFKGLWRGVTGIFKGPLKDAYDWVVNHFVKPVIHTIEGIWTWVDHTFRKSWGKIKDLFTGPVDAAKNALGGIWGGIKSKFETGVNAVIGVLNKFIRFINKVPFINLPEIPRLGGGGFSYGFARGGVLPGRDSGRDNMMVPMRSGEGVLVPRAVRALGGAKAIAAINRSAGYGRIGGGLARNSAGGYSFGGIIGSIGDSFKGAWSAASGAVKAGYGILAYPTKELGRLFDAAVPRQFRSIMSGFASWIGSRLLSWLPGAHGDDAKRAAGANVQAMTGKYGQQVARWTPQVVKALDMLGKPHSLVNAVLHRLRQESGGNPNAINLWDINAKRGYPSQGLMQVIPQTFRAYAGSLVGRGLHDPLANIFAGLNYALHRYGNIRGPMLQAGGYDSGGWLPTGVSLAYNGTGRPERVMGPSQKTSSDAPLIGGNVYLTVPQGATAADVVGELEFSLRRAQAGGRYARR
jgi:hypothetical protein